MPDGTVVGSVNVLWPEGLNSGWYLDVNRFSRHTAWAHGVMHAYAQWLGIALLVACFLAAYGVLWRRRDVHGVALLGLGGAGAIAAFGVNQAVGHAAQELRPYATYRHALVLVPKGHDYAFPSDHAVVAGALLVAVVLVLGSSPRGEHDPSARGGTRVRERRATPAMTAIAAATAVLALFLCFARVYVGAHYPGDVVAGLLLGAAIVVILSAARLLAYRVADAAVGTAFAFLFGRRAVVRRPVGPTAATGTAECGPSPLGRGRPGTRR